MAKYKPYKKDFDHSYAIGISPTIELLTYRPEQALGVLLAPDSEHSSGIQKIRKLCANHAITVEVSAKNIAAIAKNENSYAIGVFQKYSTELSPTTPHVMLVNPDDAGNLGTILRTMIGFGHKDLAIIRPGVDAFDPRVVRASMGAIFSANINYFSALENYQAIHNHNLYPFILESNTPLSQVQFTKPYALVMGNEGSGLPAAYTHVGTPVRIEQNQDIDSLNLAVAAGIALHHAYTQK